MRSSQDVSRKKGFAKIKGFCDMASSENCRYGWVDIYCIKQGDSHEVQEAINAMYLWYSQSKICFVYLEDVPRKQLADSEWFNRGWTLQELIAPKVLSFFDHDWNYIGTNTQLLAELSIKTRILENFLNHTTEPSACSVAQRMSWAAERTTTRIEDRAYSLMGLFKVRMPMMYGERENAFVRLQQEIIRGCRDESIFAWAMEPRNDTATVYSGLYALSPSVYINCNEVVKTQGSGGFFEIQGELSISLQLSYHSPGLFLTLLHCTDRACAETNNVFIIIAKTANDDNYVRVRDAENISQGILPANSGKELWGQELRFPVQSSEPPQTILYGFWLRTLQPPGYAESQITILSNYQTSEVNYIYQLCPEDGISGIVHIKPKKSPRVSEWSKVRWIKFGFTPSFSPVLWLANDSQSERLREPFEQAIASQDSGIRSQEHKQIMKQDIDDASMRSPSGGLCYEWPEGRAIVEMDVRAEIGSFFIHMLDLQILVQLLPYCSPTIPKSRGTDGNELPQRPQLVWVFDITERKRTVESRSPVAEHDHLICCICCSGSSHDLDQCMRSEILDHCHPYYPFKGYGTRKKKEEAKRAYEHDAHSFVAVLRNNPPPAELSTR